MPFFEEVILILVGAGIAWISSVIVVLIGYNLQKRTERKQKQDYLKKLIGRESAQKLLHEDKMTYDEFSDYTTTQLASLKDQITDQNIDITIGFTEESLEIIGKLRERVAELENK